MICHLPGAFGPEVSSQVPVPGRTTKETGWPQWPREVDRTRGTCVCSQPRQRLGPGRPAGGKWPLQGGAPAAQHAASQTLAPSLLRGEPVAPRCPPTAVPVRPVPLPDTPEPSLSHPALLVDKSWSPPTSPESLPRALGAGRSGEAVLALGSRSPGGDARNLELHG